MSQEQFTQLEQLIRVEDTEGIIELCNSILSESPGDSDAIHVKTIALIDSRNFAQAFDTCSNVVGLEYEQAYCLYRLQRYQESLSCCQNNLNDSAIDDKSNVRWNVLTSQVFYKLEKYLESARETEGTDDVELLTNQSAALLLSGDSQAALDLYERHKNDDQVQEQYEFTYNAACAAVDQGNSEVASHLLSTADDIVRESYDAKEAQDELAAVRVQQAYVKQLGGDVLGAAEVYTDVLKSKPSDATVAAVAAINLVSCKQDSGGARDALKKLERYDNPRMGQIQAKTMMWTHCVLLFRTHNLRKCNAKLEEFHKKYPESGLPVLLRAAIAISEKKEDEALALLESEAPKFFEAAIALAEIQSRQDPKSAALTLSSAEPLKGRVGATSTIVALLLQQGDESGALRTIRDALPDVQVSAAKEQLLMLSAKINFDAERYEEAAQDYKQVLELNPLNSKAITAFVISASHYNVEDAELMIDKVPRVTSAGDHDVAELVSHVKDSQAVIEEEAAPVTPPASTNRSQGGKRRKRRRPKKNPVPKDTNKPIDEERWLPMKDRSYYIPPKGKGRKGKGKNPKQNYSHQGSVGGNQSGALDAAAKRKAQDRIDEEKRRKANEERKRNQKRQEQAAADRKAANRAKKKQQNRKK